MNPYLAVLGTYFSILFYKFFPNTIKYFFFDKRNTYVECPATFNFTGLDETVFSKFGVGVEGSEVFLQTLKTLMVIICIQASEAQQVT